MQNRAAAWIVGSVGLLLVIGCTDGGSEENVVVEKPKVVPGECYACRGSGKVNTFGGQEAGAGGGQGAGSEPSMERPTNADGTKMTADQFQAGGGAGAGGNVPGMTQVDCNYCGGTGKTEVGSELPESADQAGRSSGGPGGGPGGGGR